MANEEKRQFLDGELIPSLSFRWESDWFCDVRKSLASIGSDHRMAIISGWYRQNWLPSSWWFDWMMAQSAFHFVRLEHPFLGSFLQTNPSIARRLKRPLRIKSMVCSSRAKQIKPRTPGKNSSIKHAMQHRSFHFILFEWKPNCMHWTNLVATFISDRE